MEINAPFSINVVDNTETNTRELHLQFQASFNNYPLEMRISLLINYINELKTNIAQEIDEPNKQGMLTILQITEQMLPHIENDEIPLDEKIIIELGTNSPLENIINNATLK